MTTHIRPQAQFWKFSCAVLLALSLTSGCAKSPDELLIGRWYSSEMTIRFRPDSGVIWNSKAGLALGRYEFDSHVLSKASTEPAPNLLLDVIRRNERAKFRFEAKLLGKDRLQLKYVPILAVGEVSDSSAIRAIVLRRANDNQLGGGTVAQR